MSDKATGAEETPKTEPKVEETKNPTVETKSSKPSEAEQQTARAIKAETKLKEMSEKLAMFEKSEEEKRIAKLEEEKKYEELKNEWATTRESLSAENETYKSEVERLRAENESFLNEKITKAMSKVPEDKRETVENIVSAYNGKAKADKIEEMIGLFGITVEPVSTKSPDFGNKKPVSQLAELEDKFSKGTINGSEYQKLKELREGK